MVGVAASRPQDLGMVGGRGQARPCASQDHPQAALEAATRQRVAVVWIGSVWQPQSSEGPPPPNIGRTPEIRQVARDGLVRFQQSVLNRHHDGSGGDQLGNAADEKLRIRRYGLPGFASGVAESLRPVDSLVVDHGHGGAGDAALAHRARYRGPEFVDHGFNSRIEILPPVAPRQRVLSPQRRPAAGREPERPDEPLCPCQALSHSYRSATVGWVRAARCAGTQHAAIATAIRSSGTPMNVRGSRGLTW